MTSLDTRNKEGPGSPVPESEERADVSRLRRVIIPLLIIVILIVVVDAVIKNKSGSNVKYPFQGTSQSFVSQLNRGEGRGDKRG